MLNKMMKLFILLIAMVFILPGCEKGSTENQTPEKQVLKIAEQFGLAYAPLQIMRKEKLIEKEFPNIEVQWVRLGNAAAIREAILCGKVDIGFMGIPPFLIGWDKGMEWKIFTGLSSAPVGLVTWKSEVKTLQDLHPSDRIALPQPGSIQHILLSMAAEQQFGEASIFDNQLVTMSHPDGMNALLSRSEISAHFTSPPYIMKELSVEGMKLVLEGTEIMGGTYTFIAGAATEELLQSGPTLLSGFLRALENGMAILSNEPEKAASLLSEEYNLPADEILSYITWDGMSYSREILGLEQFIEFMVKHGYLTKEPAAMEDILYTTPSEKLK